MSSTHSNGDRIIGTGRDGNAHRTRKRGPRREQAGARGRRACRGAIERVGHVRYRFDGEKIAVGRHEHDEVLARLIGADRNRQVPIRPGDRRRRPPTGKTMVERRCGDRAGRFEIPGEGSGIAAVSAAGWDRCARLQPPQTRAGSPRCAERTGASQGRTGTAHGRCWQSRALASSALPSRATVCRRDRQTATRARFHPPPCARVRGSPTRVCVRPPTSAGASRCRESRAAPRRDSARSTYSALFQCSRARAMRLQNGSSGYEAKRRTSPAASASSGVGRNTGSPFHS